MSIVQTREGLKNQFFTYTKEKLVSMILSLKDKNDELDNIIQKYLFELSNQKEIRKSMIEGRDLTIKNLLMDNDRLRKGISNF